MMKELIAVITFCICSNVLIGQAGTIKLKNYQCTCSQKQKSEIQHIVDTSSDIETAKNGIQNFFSHQGDFFWLYNSGSKGLKFYKFPPVSNRANPNRPIVAGTAMNDNNTEKEFQFIILPDSMVAQINQAGRLTQPIKNYLNDRAGISNSELLGNLSDRVDYLNSLTSVPLVAEDNKIYKKSDYMSLGQSNDRYILRLSTISKEEKCDIIDLVKEYIETEPNATKQDLAREVYLQMQSANPSAYIPISFVNSLVDGALATGKH